MAKTFNAEQEPSSDERAQETKAPEEASFLRSLEDKRTTAMLLSPELKAWFGMNLLPSFPLLAQ